MATPLATLADAEARIGRTLAADEESRLTALLVDASARIRAYIGSSQGDYPLVGPVVQHCKVRRGGIIRLSMIPVRSIESVNDPNNGNSIPFTKWGSAGLIAGIAGGSIINWPGDIDTDYGAGGGGGWFPWWLPSTVDVNYTAGFDPAGTAGSTNLLPDILVTICCQVAIRALQQSQPIQPNAAGAGMTSPPPGGVWLMSDEKVALDQAIPRTPVGPISMYGPAAPEPTR